MDEIGKRRIHQKLEASAIRATLARAGLYLVAYELLRYEVVERTRRFFISSAGTARSADEREYEREVCSLASNPFDASARWLSKMNALTVDQADELISIRLHRNKIAHELPGLLIDPASHLSPSMLERSRFFLDTLGRWWIRLYADTDPAFDGVELRDGDVKSGMSLLMDHVWSAVHESAT